MAEQTQFQTTIGKQDTSVYIRIAVGNLNQYGRVLLIASAPNATKLFDCVAQLKILAKLESVSFVDDTWVAPAKDKQITENGVTKTIHLPEKKMSGIACQVLFVSHQPSTQ